MRLSLLSSRRGGHHRPDGLQVVAVRRVGQWVIAGLILFAAAVLIQSVFVNPNFHWEVVGEWLFSPRILNGLLNTLILTVASESAGIVLGIAIATMLDARNPIFRGVANAYTWIFRGTPLFVQILIWGYLSALYEKLSLGIPFTDITFWSIDTRYVMTPWLAAILGLGLNEGAYMAEIIRAGLMSVDRGQIEAGQATGMNARQIFFRIRLPQAMRVIIPPTGNQVISMLKTTSIVSVIAFQELLYSAQLIYAANFQTIPLLLVASFWYLVVTSILTLIQRRIEAYFGKGVQVSSSRRRANSSNGRAAGAVDSGKPSAIGVA